MSFREIAVTIRAVNRASAEFSRVNTDAARMGSQVKATQESMSSSFKLLVRKPLLWVRK